MGWLRKKILIPLIYRKAARIITVSDGLKKELTEDFALEPAKITTVYNGLSINTIIALSRTPLPDGHERIFHDHFVIVTHCRFARQKNLHSLIALISALKKNREIRWLILGDGELRDPLLDACAAEGLETYHVWKVKKPSFDEQVYFLGYIENPYNYLRNADLYIMTSSWEGYPLSLIEAMVCELPIISSDCHTGPAEIITCSEPAEEIRYPFYGECGVLMPMIKGTDDLLNLELWKKEVLHLAGNEAVREKFRAGAKKNHQRFSNEVLNEKVLQLINEI
jgi:glycosyltransferase involved in cell wall biosynthesis